jgi:hypothetical protein
MIIQYIIKNTGGLNFEKTKKGAFFIQAFKIGLK